MNPPLDSSANLDSQGSPLCLVSTEITAGLPYPPGISMGSEHLNSISNTRAAGFYPPNHLPNHSIQFYQQEMAVHTNVFSHWWGFGEAGPATLIGLFHSESLHILAIFVIVAFMTLSI